MAKRKVTEVAEMEMDSLRQPMLTTKEVAERLRKKPATLRTWRYFKIGPPSWKSGPGQRAPVLYPERDFYAWWAKHRGEVA